MITFLSTWSQLDNIILLVLFLPVIISYSIDSTLLGSTFLQPQAVFVWHITHIDKAIKVVRRKDIIL